MTVIRESGQHWKRILPHAILIAILMVFSLAFMIPAVSADREIIQDVITYGSPACPNYGMYVKEDMDNNGVFDTMVVFQTINGYASPDSWGYFFTVPSATGGSCSYQAPGRGRYIVYFVDMLASGFIETNPGTWTFRSFPGADLTGFHNEQQWDWNLPTPYLGISAYRGRNQVDPISGVHIPPNVQNGLESWSFMDSGGSGIKELYISTDYSENAITAFTIRTQSANAGTITVTSPNGGETWQRGTSHTVRWSYTGSPGSTVKIVLLKGGAEVGTIIGSTSIGSSGTGSYTWPVSSTGTTGSDYKVRVQSISQPTIQDTSNNVFTLTPASTTPTITVTSPNGGETWQRGTSHTVRWSYTGSPGSTVKIVLLKGGAEVGTIIGSTSIGSSGTGSYSWPVSSTGTTGSDYKVRVQSINQPTIQDTSNNIFTITPQGPFITVISPNGAETWQRGTSHKITWNYNGLPDTNDVKIVLLKAGVEVGTIASSASTGDYYTWEINPSGTTGSDYQVGLQSISKPYVKDVSNTYFTITPAGTPCSITVTSPNGGQTWKRGTSHAVTWTYSGSCGPTVKIMLLKAGSEVGTIASSAPIGSGGLGSYTWNINPTGATGSDYRVSIQSISQPAGKDTSNSNFILTL